MPTKRKRTVTENLSIKPELATDGVTTKRDRKAAAKSTKLWSQSKLHKLIQIMDEIEGEVRHESIAFSSIA